MPLPKLKGAGSDLASVLSSRVLGMVMQMLTFVLLARCALPAAFGSYSQTYSYLLVAIGLSDLGVQALVGREFAVPELREWGRKAYWLQALLAAATATVLSVVLLLLPNQSAIAWVIPWQVFIEIQQACTLSLALAAGHAVVQVRTMFLSRFPAMVAMLLVLASPLRGVAALSVYLATAIASTLLAVLWILKTLDILGRIGLPSDWREILRRSRHFLESSASWQIRQLDTAFVGWLATPAQAAFYAVPARLVGPLRLFETSITSVAVPYVRRREVNRVRKLSMAMAGVTVAMVVGFTAVSFFLPFLVRVVLGAAYLPTVNPLRMMLAATAALMAANYVTAVVQAAGHERFVGRQGTVLALMFVVLVPLGAHFGQATGAAAGVFVVNMVQFLTSLGVGRSVLREFRALAAQEAADGPAPQAEDEEAFPEPSRAVAFNEALAGLDQVRPRRAIPSDDDTFEDRNPRRGRPD